MGTFSPNLPVKCIRRVTEYQISSSVEAVRVRVLGFDIQTGTELRRWHVMLCIYTVTVLEFASERATGGWGMKSTPLNLLRISMRGQTF